MAPGDVAVRGAGNPVAEAFFPVQPVTDQMTLADVERHWGAFYHLECLDVGAYKATRPDGMALPVASTPAGLESAIRADFSRWGSR